jgi:hypothetical protein
MNELANAMASAIADGSIDDDLLSVATTIYQRAQEIGTGNGLNAEAMIIDIANGKADGWLYALGNTVSARAKAIDDKTALSLFADTPTPARDDRIFPGDDVRIIGKLRPNYLYGYSFTVKKVNQKTVSIDVPDLAHFRRFAGQKGVRIPKSAVEKVS